MAIAEIYKYGDRIRSHDVKDGTQFICAGCGRRELRPKKEKQIGV